MRRLDSLVDGHITAKLGLIYVYLRAFYYANLLTLWWGVVRLGVICHVRVVALR